MARVDYANEVYCSGCEEKYLKDQVELRYGYGYKCPKCGIKCRTKAKESGQKYIPNRIGNDRIKVKKPRDFKEMYLRQLQLHPDYNKQRYKRRKENRIAKEKSRMV